MKRKSFQSYLEKRLDPDTLAEIEIQAHAEVKILKAIQDAVTNTIDEYMEKNKIGFNELVKRLDASPTHVAKIQKGEANLTIASLAHILALVGKEPGDIFGGKMGRR